MAGIMEYKPELGSVEAHQALAKKYLADAEFDYRRAVEENLSPEVVAAAKERFDAYTAEYEAFIQGFPKGSEDPKTQMPESGLH